jgi:hypothetical protein
VYTTEASHLVCLPFRELGEKCQQTFLNNFQTFFYHDPIVLNNFHSHRRVPNIQTKRLRRILSKSVQVEVSIFLGKRASQLK